MRKIILSCGSNKGGEFDAWLSSRIYDPEVLIYAFEPEPRCFPFIEEKQKLMPNITHIKSAISTIDGIEQWNVGNLTVSGTLRQDKNWGLTGEKVMIQTLNFSRWLKENIKEDDYVFCTLDIEGSEYDVIKDLFATGAIDLINKFYVEFHDVKLHTNMQDEEKKLKNMITEKFGMNCFFRFVEGNFRMFKQAHPDLDENMYNNIGPL
tara:strand:- start:4607 stop:5227 length:621 start_codon:yes stop_codon:yes gene_type:complete